LKNKYKELKTYDKNHKDDTKGVVAYS